MEKGKIYTTLKEILGDGRVQIDEAMKNHTSFKIGGSADFFVKVEDVEQIKNILNVSKANSVPLTIIGNGSNLLVRDNGIRGIVLKIDLKKIDINSTGIVTVGAGVLLGQLAQKLATESITGFEFAAGIPGTIGGAIAMNAGAYGTEFKDIVLQVTYMDLDGNIYTVNNEECKFDYRHSMFKNNNFIVLETKLGLKYAENSDLIKQKMNELLQQRKLKQPVSMPSGGSTFKRGTDFIAAKLIDECGLKGYSIGGAEVSDVHAGFIVNKGNATAKDVLQLVDYVKKCVKEKFNKEIELEICVIGE